jgi:hypothetical protein
MSLAVESRLPDFRKKDFFLEYFVVTKRLLSNILCPRYLALPPPGQRCKQTTTKYGSSKKSGSLFA